MNETNNQSNNTNTEHLREMNEIEHLYLAQVLGTLPAPKKRYLKAALNTAVFWVFSLFGFCILWFLSSLILTTFASIDIGISSDYSTVIFPIAVVVAGLFAFNSTRKWLSTSESGYTYVKADLAAQKIQAERYKVKSVKCFKETKHGGLLYFLLLKHPVSKQKSIRVIYDYESQNDKIDPKLLLQIKTVLTICTAPNSKIVVDNVFEGDPVTKVEYFDLTASPEQWPNPDSWEDIEWSSLQQIYSK
ncbi:hypothetical protein V6255_01540 [Psychromonas arctica]|uniref:Uncharacterized protein n=1 Tax=Psychromonas arctica TaxID=168275 RepID=A0ABU9H7N4_9GAMM